jgi:hypothetical protein
MNDYAKSLLVFKRISTKPAHFEGIPGIKTGGNSAILNSLLNPDILFLDVFRITGLQVRQLIFPPKAYRDPPSAKGFWVTGA